MLGDSGITPIVDVSPTVGLRPITALRSAGNIILPSVSVPMLNAHIFEASELALPELEPPGWWARL
jgi:hypothetical protein